MGWQADGLSRPDEGGAGTGRPRCGQVDRYADTLGAYLSAMLRYSRRHFFHSGQVGRVGGGKFYTPWCKRGRRPLPLTITLFFISKRKPVQRVQRTTFPYGMGITCGQDLSNACPCLSISAELV